MNEKETILLMHDLHYRVTDIQNRLYENMTRAPQYQTDYDLDLKALTEMQKELIIIDEQMKEKNSYQLTKLGAKMFGGTPHA